MLDSQPSITTGSPRNALSSSDVVEIYKLDRLTRVRPSVLLAIYVPGIAVLVFLTYQRLPAVTATGLLIGGYLFWTLFEYWVHRLVLHWEPQQRILARLQWMAHGHHHAYPRDPFRLFFPLVFSVPILLACLVLFIVTMGVPSGSGIGAGFVAGYVLMDTIHYLLHRRCPASAAGRRLHELHMQHHFDNEAQGYGLSIPWWDLVFGTYSRRRVHR